MTLRRTYPRVLIVEGKNEQRVFPYLLESAGIPWPDDDRPVKIEEQDGISNIVAPGFIETTLKASGVTAVGIVVDANGDPARRWERLRARLVASYPDFPVELPATGAVHAIADKPRIGVWVMPDNVRTAEVWTATGFAKAGGQVGPRRLLTCHRTHACIDASGAWAERIGHRRRGEKVGDRLGGRYRRRMRWPEVRAAYPDQWLVIEALDAHSENDRRVLDRIAVIDVCADGRTTMKRYGELRRRHPQREFCFVHTSMAELQIEERLWLGLRGPDRWSGQPPEAAAGTAAASPSR
jgi:hypothetical protein